MRIMIQPDCLTNVRHSYNSSVVTYFTVPKCKFVIIWFWTRVEFQDLSATEEGSVAFVNICLSDWWTPEEIW